MFYYYYYYYYCVCVCVCVSPKGATSFPDRGSYEYDQIRVLVFILLILWVY